MNDIPIHVYAFFGGIAINLINLTELRNMPRLSRPETFSDPIYVLWFFGMPILGSVLAYAYQMSEISLTPIIAINVGASAPVILKSFAAAFPSQIEKRRTS